MILVTGQVANLLRDPDGELKGLLFQDGREVRFPAALGHLVSPILSEGCFVGVEGVSRIDDFPGGYIFATHITNLDSQQAAVLPALKHKGKPGMQPSTTPVDSASPATSDAGPEEEAGLACSFDSGEISYRAGSCEDDAVPVPLFPSSFFRSMLEEVDQSGINFARNDSAKSIGQAYDNLHRIQAILAYLHIMKHPVPGISQFLDEAKHTYVQALSRFATGDFLGAKEFAEASEGLSRVVEIIMARTFRSESHLLPLSRRLRNIVWFGPNRIDVEEDLPMRNQFFPEFIGFWNMALSHQKIALKFGKSLLGEMRFTNKRSDTYRTLSWKMLPNLRKRRFAGAYSAEHVCRKWYSNHPAAPIEWPRGSKVGFPIQLRAR